jgi:hypothetical protein
MSEETQVTGEQETEAAAPVEAVQSESHDGASEHGNNVPLEALQAERAQRQQLQEELRVIKDHIALMQAGQQSQQKQAPADDFEGMSQDDVLTVGELKKILAQKENKYEMSLQELKMTQKHPDYETVITRYLPEVLKQNPGLRQTLQNSQDYELAYYLAKNSDAYKAANKQAKKNADAERIVQNAQQAGSLSSVGSTSPVNQARRYKDMSDADFRALVNRNSGHF